MRRNFKWYSKKICSVALAMALSTSLVPAEAFVSNAAESTGVVYDLEVVTPAPEKDKTMTNVKVTAPVAAYDFTKGELGNAVTVGSGASIVSGTGVTLSGNANTANEQWGAGDITDNASLAVPGIGTTGSAISIKIGFTPSEDRAARTGGLFKVGTSVSEGVAVTMNEAANYHGCVNGAWIDANEADASAMVKANEYGEAVFVLEANGNMAVYTNGKKVSSGKIACWGTAATAETSAALVNEIISKGITIGGNSAATSNNGLPVLFNGTVSKVEMFDYAMSEEQVKADYNGDIYVPAADYTYDFDNNAGKAVAVVHPSFASAVVELATQPAFTYVDSKDGSKAIKLDGTYGLRLDDISGENRSSYSYSFWINPDEIVNNTPIIGLTSTGFGQDGTGGESWAALAGDVKSNVKFWSLNNNTQKISHTTAGATTDQISAGKWSFVTISVDDNTPFGGTAGHATATVYVDGKKSIFRKCSSRNSSFHSNRWSSKSIYRCKCMGWLL